LGEVEDVVGVGPRGYCDRDCWVEPGNSKLQHPPEVLVSVVRLIADGCQGRAHLRGERNWDEPGEELHKALTHWSIADEAKARGTETLEAIF
jgi:hypothetical protein